MATRLARPAVLSGLIILVYLVLQLVVPSGWGMFPDSYRYARAAEQVLGVDRDAAHAKALEAFCASRGDQAAHEAKLQPGGGNPRDAVELACQRRWATSGDITSTDPRYQAIFDTRPAYPVLVAPFVKVFGIAHGMRIFGVLMALLGSLMLAGLLRSAGASGLAAVAGQTLFLASPLGYWSLQALGEGLFTACVLGVIWGGILVMRGRRLSGALLLTGAYAVGAVTRYSSVLVVAAFATVAGFTLWGIRRTRGDNALILAGISGGTAVLTLLSMRLFDLPSSEVTLQDTFTQHFTSPDVDNPWQRLIKLAAHLWSDWLVSQSAPIYLVLAAVAVVTLARRNVVLASLAIAAGLTGIATVTAHPLVQESDRLGVLMWVPVALGLPFIIDALRAKTAAPEPVAEPLAVAAAE